MALSWDNTLTYEKTFAQDHSLKVMVGYSYRETKTNSLTGSAEDIIDIPEINQSYLFLTIGKGAKVGANAVVLQDVPPYATAVGIPARIITAQEKEEKQRQD